MYAVHIASPPWYFGASSRGSDERTVHLLSPPPSVFGDIWVNLKSPVVGVFTRGHWQMIHVRAPLPHSVRNTVKHLAEPLFLSHLST